MDRFLLLTLLCLSMQVIVSNEPPPSPREGRDAGKEAFIQRLRARQLIQAKDSGDRLLEKSEAHRQADFEEGLLPPCNDRQNVEIKPLSEWLEDATKKVLAQLKDNQVCNCNCGKPKNSCTPIGKP